MMTTVTYYTRKKCPLCDRGKDVLLELKKVWDFHLEEIDIEESDELTEKYGLMIPVVEIDGEEVQFGQIDKYTISKYFYRKNVKQML